MKNQIDSLLGMHPFHLPRSQRKFEPLDRDDRQFFRTTSQFLFVCIFDDPIKAFSSILIHRASCLLFLKIIGKITSARKVTMDLFTINEATCRRVILFITMAHVSPTTNKHGLPSTIVHTGQANWHYSATFQLKSFSEF